MNKYCFLVSISYFHLMKYFLFYQVLIMVSNLETKSYGETPLSTRTFFDEVDRRRMNVIDSGGGELVVVE